MAAVEAESAVPGYFTWGTGGNFASILLALLAIILSVVMAVLVTVREDKTLNEAAARLQARNASMSG